MDFIFNYCVLPNFGSILRSMCVCGVHWNIFKFKLSWTTHIQCEFNCHTIVKVCVVKGPSIVIDRIKWQLYTMVSMPRVLQNANEMIGNLYLITLSSNKMLCTKPHWHNGTEPQRNREAHTQRKRERERQCAGIMRRRDNQINTNRIDFGSYNLDQRQSNYSHLNLFCEIVNWNLVTQTIETKADVPHARHFFPQFILSSFSFWCRPTVVCTHAHRCTNNLYIRVLHAAQKSTFSRWTCTPYIFLSIKLEYRRFQ